MSHLITNLYRSLNILMNQINKFIVIALAALLLQSCASELQISELQLYARKTADVYEKQEYRKWDRLVEAKNTEIKANREALVAFLRNQSDMYRTLRAFHVLIEDNSLFAFNEDFVNRSENKSCQHPNDARIGQPRLLEFHSKSGQDRITLTSNKRSESYKQRNVNLLNNQELYQVLEKDVQNYIECTESASPGIVFDEDKQWLLPESVWNARASLLESAIINRVYFAISQ